MYSKKSNIFRSIHPDHHHHDSNSAYDVSTEHNWSIKTLSETPYIYLFPFPPLFFVGFWGKFFFPCWFRSSELLINLNIFIAFMQKYIKFLYYHKPKMRRIKRWFRQFVRAHLSKCITLVHIQSQSSKDDFRTWWHHKTSTPQFDSMFYSI